MPKSGGSPSENSVKRKFAEHAMRQSSVGAIMQALICSPGLEAEGGLSYVLREQAESR